MTSPTASFYWYSDWYTESAVCDIRLYKGQERTYNEANRRTAHNALERLIKQGAAMSCGTDIPVEGSKVYGTSWWDIVRKRVIDRDGGRCALCGQCPKDKFGAFDGHVHHILPRHLGGSDNPVNLVCLCEFCHIWVHRDMRFELKRINAKVRRITDYWEAEDV